MNNFSGLVSLSNQAEHVEAASLLPPSDRAHSVFLESSSCLLSIDSTSEWSVVTTPDYYCVATGHLSHAQFGSLDATGASRAIAENGLESLRGSDGSYIVGQICRRTNEFKLFCDPMGTQPVFYQQNGDRMAFGSQAKWLARYCGVRSRVNADGALQFLMNRYPVGYDSMFAGAMRLPPGHMLLFDPVQQLLKIERYWDLKFEPGIDSMSIAVEELHKSLTASHELIFDELAKHGQTYRVFLTGGLDSRGILGYAQLLDCLPQVAETWGGTDGIADSDPVIAKQLADTAGVPFRFREVRADSWVEHSADWAWHGELQTDNANSYATPLDFFVNPSLSDCRFAVAGDQMLGAGPIPSSLDQAINNVSHAAYSAAAGPLSKLLKRESHAAMLSGFDKGVRNLVDTCPNSHPKDVQDYLYFHNYICRWILAPGNFKHPVLSVRRPLMTLNVVELGRQFSPDLRVDKAAYVNLMTRKFPQLMALPVMAAESGVNWSYHSRIEGGFRDELMRLTRPEKLESLAIYRDLDVDATTEFVNDFFSEQPARTQVGGRGRRRLYDARRVIGRVPFLRNIAGKLQPLVKRLAGIERVEGQRNRYELVMRLALLAIFEEQLATRNRHDE